MDKETNLNLVACPLPAASQPDHPTAPRSSKLSRRSFLKMGVGALSTLALLEIGGAGFLFLRSRSLEGEYGGVIKAGLLDNFPPGSITEFADSHFFLIRSDDGGFLAVHNRCTHLGCIVNWEPSENNFICPCHAATFDFFGHHEGPPVPRPLDIFAVTFDEATVKVDTSQPQQRERFTPEQLVYAPIGGPVESSSQRPDRGPEVPEG